MGKYKYLLMYEAIVFNFPAFGEINIYNHKLIDNEFDSQELNCSYQGLSFFRNSETVYYIYNYENKSYYKKAIIQDFLELYLDDNINQDNFLEYNSTNAFLDAVYQTVDEHIKNLENILILTTNNQILLPSVITTIYDESKQYIGNTMFRYNKPVWPRKVLSTPRDILFKRLNMKINFDSVLDLSRNNPHFNRALMFYYESFYVQNPAVSFTVLCSAIDSITGSNQNNQTKERFSKYTSLLLFDSINLQRNYNQMRELYKKRSDFIHGNEVEITVTDEYKLREIVRIILITYFLLSSELETVNNKIVIQKLDEIKEKPALYKENYTATYTSMQLLYEYELGNKIFGLSQKEQRVLVERKLSEAALGHLDSVKDKHK